MTQQHFNKNLWLKAAYRSLEIFTQYSNFHSTCGTNTVQNITDLLKFILKSKNQGIQTFYPLTL